MLACELNTCVNILPKIDIDYYEAMLSLFGRQNDKALIISDGENLD